MMWLKKFIVCMGVIALIILGLTVQTSFAQTKKRVYLEFEAAVVEGRVQRPEAVYIIQRAGLDFASQVRKESFLKEITESIERKPF